MLRSSASGCRGATESCPTKRKGTPWHEKVRRYTSVQVRLAKELLAEAGIGVDEPCGLPEWEKLQSVLSKKGLSLIVVSRDSVNTVVYHGGDGSWSVCIWQTITTTSSPGCRLSWELVTCVAIALVGAGVRLTTGVN